MSKKFVFSVVAKSRRKMVFVQANRTTNVIFAVVSFWIQNALMIRNAKIGIFFIAPQKKI